LSKAYKDSLQEAGNSHFLAYLLSSFFNCQHIKNMQFNNHAEHFRLQYFAPNNLLTTVWGNLCCTVAPQYIATKSSNRKQWLCHLMAHPYLPLHVLTSVMPSSVYSVGHTVSATEH